VIEDVFLTGPQWMAFAKWLDGRDNPTELETLRFLNQLASGQPDREEPPSKP